MPFRAKKQCPLIRNFSMRVRREFRRGKEIYPLIRVVRLLESPLIEDYTADPFGNVNVKLSDNVFSKSEFSLLHKNLDFCSRPNKYNKQNLKKDLLSYTVILNLGHTLDQLEIIQMSLDLIAIVIGYQINYPAVLKPS